MIIDKDAIHVVREDPDHGSEDGVVKFFDDGSIEVAYITISWETLDKIRNRAMERREREKS